MDALESVLGAMRLSGAVFLDARFTAPWCMTAKVGPEDCKPFMPVPAHVIAYHYVLEGQPFTEAGAHHLLVFPRNDAHTLASAPGLRPVSADDLIAGPGADGLARIRHGGGGAGCRILCGFLANQDRANPLIASLPPLLTLSVADEQTRQWIEGSIRYAARKQAVASGDGASGLARIAELLFAEAVRDYVKSLPPGATGWLAGLRDPYVGRAIALMHDRPLHPWRLEELASQVGLSRSALGARFQRALSVSPMRYLGRRRLQQAADRLQHSAATIGEIAFEAGYESEAAFTHAFKREFGVSPAAFRRAATCK